MLSAYRHLECNYGICCGEPTIAIEIAFLLRILTPRLHEWEVVNAVKWDWLRCVACCIDPSGERACVDGPVFYGSELVGSEFGRYRRGADGVRVSIA